MHSILIRLHLIITSLLLFFSFLHSDWTSSTPLASVESVSVDLNISSGYLTSSDSRQLANTTSNDQTVALTANQGWYMPPATKTEGTPSKTPGIENSTCSSSNSQCSPSSERLSAPNHDSVNNQNEFRSRSEVMSNPQITAFRQSESYSRLKSKKLNNRSHFTQPPLHDGSTETQEPPPLPPKPKKFSSTASSTILPINDRTAGFDSSSSSIHVYHHTNCSHCELLSKR